MHSPGPPAMWFLHMDSHGSTEGSPWRKQAQGAGNGLDFRGLSTGGQGSQAVQPSVKRRAKAEGIGGRLGWEGPRVRVGVLSPRHLYWRAPNSAPQPRWEWKWPTALLASQVTHTLNLSSS